MMESMFLHAIVTFYSKQKISFVDLARPDNFSVKWLYYISIEISI